MWHRRGYERKQDELAPTTVYVARLAHNVAIAACLTLVALGCGVIGFVIFADLSPIDAFLNSAMLISGMGPTSVYTSWGAKLFAGVFALFSGLFILVIMSFVLAPVFHRMLHRFHLAGEPDGDQPALTKSAPAPRRSR